MNNNERILKVLFENPTRRFHIRELARITKLNPNTILNNLKKENIIKMEKKKHITEILADIDNKKFIIKKRIFNIFQLYNCGLVDFLEKEYPSKAICVIGSYSRGEDIEKSDIDIVIITNLRDKYLDMNKFEKLLNRKIHLILTDYKNMSDEFYTNLINGVILSGCLGKK